MSSRQATQADIKQIAFITNSGMYKPCILRFL